MRCCRDHKSGGVSPLVREEIAVNVVVWIVQVVLALLFAFVGLGKLARPKEDLRERMGWVDDFSQGTIRLIGAAEVLGALGLVLPAATGVATWLTPTAAVGL